MPRIKSLYAAAAVISLFPMLSFAASTQVTREMMKDQWPFSIASGVLVCEQESITLTANGKTYAVNGTAKTRGKNLGWRDAREIWQDNVALPGTKVSIGPLIAKGLRLCE